MTGILRRAVFFIFLFALVGGSVHTALAQDSTATDDTTGVTPHDSTLAVVRKAIDHANALWVQAFKDSNPGLVASVFDEYGAMLGGRGNITYGQDAIRESMARWMKQLGPTDATVNTLNLWLMGDLAYESGEYSYTFSSSKGSDSTIKGKYVVVWKRQTDGGWKILRDIALPE